MLPDFAARQPSERDRSGEEANAQGNFRKCQGLRETFVRPRTRDAFGEVGEDEHAGPLVGVAPASHNSTERQRERKRLQREPRVAMPQRRKPKLPCQTQRDQPDERGKRRRSREQLAAHLPRRSVMRPNY